MACFLLATFFPAPVTNLCALYSCITLAIFFGQHFFTDFFIYTFHTHIFTEMEKDLLLFAEEGAVYHLNGEPEGGYILKMKPLDTSQSIWVPQDWVEFPVPTVINEKIYYYLFIEMLRERNFEAAYYYATHVSMWLTKRIYRDWFEQEIDLAFETYPDISMIYAQIRANITFASLLFDVNTDDNSGQVYPLKLEFVSRFKKRTSPLALCKPPYPFQFVDNHIAFDLYEMDDPLEIAHSFQIDTDSESEFATSLMTEPAVFQNIHYLEFRKGPTNGDYCLVDGTSIAPGIIQVTERIHPCIFLELYDCKQDPWVNVENYRLIQNHKGWQKFQKFLQFCIDPKLKLFFNVAPTNTFVALQ